MTKENIIRLYAHYRKIGYKEAEQDLVKKYPFLTEPSEDSKVSKSSK